MRSKYAFILAFVAIFILLFSSSYAQNNDHIEKEVFSQLNLDYPGLQVVKREVKKGNYNQASSALLDYFRNRHNVQLPEYNKSDEVKYKNKQLPLVIQQKADSGLQHIFYVHAGYGYNGDGYLHYDKDINWQYWPVKDNEIRWQVNRMYWWIPMGLAYWSTGDEKYAKEWIFQYQDWVKKNPLGLSLENDHFAWRQLEVSNRLQDQTALLNMFVKSPYFTSSFLIEFLWNYYNQAQYLLHHYTQVGNHLLFESQRMLYAGCFFPEFKQSDEWIKSGINNLNEQIKKQVYPDGLQFELSPNYHVASINIFVRALEITKLNHHDNEFPQSFPSTVKHMIAALINFSFPDYTYPMFGDAKLVTKEEMLKQYQDWLKVFPDDSLLKYFTTEGKEGAKPTYLSKGLTSGGFYTFRNGWDDSSTVMVLKAGPPAFFHNQPDNGTFDLWVKGRNFMPDAGSYVYSGDSAVRAQRNWFRQTRVHQTLTLNDANIKIDSAELLKWSTSNTLDVLSYKNPSYDNLTHQRTVFFVDKKFFVIVDEAIGSARGEIELHYELAPGKAASSNTDNLIHSDYDDGNNLLIQCYSSDPINLKKEIGKVSYHYRESVPRPAFAFVKRKKNKELESFITVLYPYSGETPPKVMAGFTSSNNLEKGDISLIVKINGQDYKISTNINEHE